MVTEQQTPNTRKVLKKKDISTEVIEYVNANKNHRREPFYEALERLLLPDVDVI